MNETAEQADRPPRDESSGGLAGMVSVMPEAAIDGQRLKIVLIKSAILGGLFVWLNTWQFQVLKVSWDSPNWSHGYIIPLFSLFLLYNRRNDLFAAAARPCLWALPLLLMALVGQMIAYYPIGNYWLAQLSMVATLFFLVLYLTGARVMKFVWLPILYLALAMPISDRIYTGISLPLQELAAQSAVIILRLFGVQIEVVGSALSLLSRSGIARDLLVAEACSGMRSLMAYVALGVAWAYLEERPMWQRLVLVVSIVPVAVLCNVVRVAITCGAYAVDHPELGKEFMHTFTGMVMLIPALGMFLLLSWLLKNLFVEEDDEHAGGAENPQEASS